MKYILIALLLCHATVIMSQTDQQVEEGFVSYVTPQQVYVKFASTSNINIGDTLYIQEQDFFTAVLLVKNKSSISCVCEIIPGKEVKISQRILAKTKESTQDEGIKADKPISVPESASEVIEPINLQSQLQPKKLSQTFSGRLSLASYTNISSSSSDISQRMRYTFSMKAGNIRGKRLSAETYLSFSHKDHRWDEIKEDIFNGLKIYKLALQYQINERHSVWFGRRINPRISQLGASDGVQYEARMNQFTTGLVAGSRPDNVNYSINTKLFQYGAYISHEMPLKKGNIQSSMAFIEQKNNGQTDRRFAYLQHSNTILPNVFLFGSVEFELYQKVNEIKSNKVTLSNTFFSIRYKAFKQLSLSLSYSARQNIIYYETYKTLIERLLETESTQGYQFQANYRPVNKITMGIRAGYRNRKSDLKPSKNLYSYISVSQLPWIHSGGLISATFLETSYMKGTVYSAGLTKDLMQGKINGTLTYRNVLYNYYSGEFTQRQNIAELSLGWRLAKKLMLSANFEHTFEKKSSNHRIYLSITQRF